jgi:O-antigen/teichoic acid export membrane protein
VSDLVAGPSPRRSDGQEDGAGPTVVSGALAAFAGQSLVYVAGFMTSIAVARALGAEGRGEYYVPVTAAAICLAIVSLGIESANVVSLAERGRSLSQLSANSSLMALAIGPFAVAALLAAFLLFSSELFRGVELPQYLIVVATVPFSLHMLWLANIFLLGHQLRRSQVALSVGALLQLVGAYALLSFGLLGVTEVLALYAVSVLAPWGLHVRWAGAFTSVRPAIDGQVAREILGVGLKMHPGLVFSYLLLRIDIFFVSAYLGTAEVGIYSLAVLFAELTWLLTNPLVQAAIPFQAATESSESAPLAFKAARFNFALALLVSAGLAATLWIAIPLLYGEEFATAYSALLLLLPGILAMAAARPLTVLVSRQRRPALYSVIAALAFVLNCLLNVLLLPSLGILGASLASTVSYAALSGALIVWALAVSPLKVGQALIPQAGDRETILRSWHQARKAAHGWLRRWRRA